MARRSERKTKAPKHFNPILPIHDSSAQTSKKNKRSKHNPLTPSNALQTTSPILKEDIQSLFVSTVINWLSMSEDKKRGLIDAFPPTYRFHNMDETGKLKCPISEEFVENDKIIKRDVARFKRDVEAGFYVKKWQEQGNRAMKERAEGQFDDYIKQHADDNFGQAPKIKEDHEMVDAVDENRFETDGEGKRD